MENKELIQAAKKQMRQIGLDVATAPLETAKIVGMPYDPSMPVNKMIGTILTFDTVEAGEDYEYFIVDEDVKQVYLLGADCNVTSVAVTPNTELALTFAEYTTPEFYLCIKTLLEAKYDVLARKRETIRRSMDNVEVKKVIDLFDAAVPVANVHGLSTGKTKFGYDNLCAMVEDVANYGTSLHLVMGTNVNKDIILWNFDNDKNQPISPADFGVTTHVIRGTVKVDAGSVAPILDPNVAYLVATSDSEENKPGYFVRRKLDILNADGEERAILNTSPVMAIGSNRKLAFAVVGYENIACVITNANTISKFERV